MPSRTNENADSAAGRIGAQFASFNFPLRRIFDSCQDFSELFPLRLSIAVRRRRLMSVAEGATENICSV
jgi:hypothetical protein